MTDELRSYLSQAENAMVEEKWETSASIWRKILQRWPDHHFSRYNCARCCWQVRQIEASMELLAAIPTSYSNYGAVLNLRAILLMEMGEHAQATQCYQAALSLLPDSAHCWSNYLLSLLYQSDWAPEDIASEHRKYGRKWDRNGAENDPTEPSPCLALSGRRLKIGFLSSDFKLHSVSYFAEPVISECNRTHFELFLYSDVRNQDAMTSHLRQRSDHFRDTAHIPRQQLVSTIRQDQLDILIELGGHTGNNALPELAQRLAPIQVSWMGYPHSTGLETIDYRLSDSRIEPLPEFQSYSSERIFHIPEGCHCYRMPGEAREVTPLPMKSRGYPTFICCNTAAKISNPCLASWAQLLRVIPESRILLKNSTFAIPEIGSKVCEFFERRGVSRERIQIRPLTKDYNDHLATYAEADVALDTFPYNGTTTTCEAFWSGLPVLTLEGKTAAGRHGMSLVSQMNLGEWIATSTDDYVQRAEKLVADVERMDQLRHTMRSRLTRSSLGDHAWMSRRFEYVMMSIWVEHNQKHIPETHRLQMIADNEASLKAGRIAHLFRAGSLAIADHDFPGAIQVFTEAALSEECPHAWVALGRIASATQNWTMGETAWKHACEAYPDNEEYLMAFTECVQSLRE